MKKTFKELKEIDSIVGKLYGKDKNLKESKFGYAYKRFSEKNYVPMAKEFNNALEMTRIDNALEDPTTKVILTDNNSVRGYKYSKEGLKAVINSESKLEEEWNMKEVEIIPFISSLVPENMTEEDSETLRGILIK